MEDSKDTVNLLKECDAGAKMAVASIEEVVESIQDSKLRRILTECEEKHEKLATEIHSLLTKHHSPEKEPSPMAKGMSWIKTNMMLAMDESDKTVADLITDGCNMGVKSLHKYLNQYRAADDTAKDVCKRLVTLEADLSEELRCYL